MKSLTLPNTFTSYQNFCYVLIAKIFVEKFISDSILEIDETSDFSNRIFITMENGKEYIIRTWNIHDDDDNVYVDYTLFLEDNGTTVELSCN
jgi:hypothetical protein